MAWAHRESRRSAAAAGLAGALVTGAAATLGASSYALRRLVTPERDRPENVAVLAVDGDVITLRADEETTLAGRYGLWLDGGRGHARLGDIIGRDATAGTVTREVHAVEAGALRPGPARWSSFYFGIDPLVSLGLPFVDEQIPGPVGALPAWVVPAPGAAAPHPGAGRRWAVLVHGRGALRAECLRAVPSLHAAGWTCLILGYRNDEDAPASNDRRYALGLSEWADVEAALAWARAGGAREFALVGWSMGGAIVLQTAARSSYGDRITHLVLDAPVVDWGDVLRHHLRLGRVPGVVARVAPHVLRSPGARHLVGIESPLDVAQTDWAGRAAELRHRTLLIHSVDDEFVPVGPSQTLAAARPDLVTFVPWRGAAHTKEWNTDPQLWDATVGDFVR